jgi:hypothetical protein
VPGLVEVACKGLLHQVELLDFSGHLFKILHVRKAAKNLKHHLYIQLVLNDQLGVKRIVADKLAIVGSPTLAQRTC